MRKQLREVRRREPRQACPLATEGGLGALHGSLCFGERYSGAGRRPPAVKILPSSAQRLFRPLACIIKRAQLLRVAQRASLGGVRADLLALRPPAWHKRHPRVQHGQQLRVEVLEAEPARERRSECVRRVVSCRVGEPRRLLLQPTTLRLGADEPFGMGSVFSAMAKGDVYAEAVLNPKVAAMAEFSVGRGNLISSVIGR